MPRRKPKTLSTALKGFYESKQEGRIMFCKRYYIQEMWNIGIGAILDLNSNPNPGLVRLCQRLHREDTAWFVGDTEALLRFEFRQKRRLRM